MQINVYKKQLWNLIISIYIFAAEVDLKKKSSCGVRDLEVTLKPPELRGWFCLFERCFNTFRGW